MSIQGAGAAITGMNEWTSEVLVFLGKLGIRIYKSWCPKKIFTSSYPAPAGKFGIIY